MAWGRPVIASDLPPLREIVGDDRGLLVPAEDPTALASAIRELAADPAARRRLGEAGRAEVIARRTWSGAAATYARIYASVIGVSPDASGVASTGPTPDRKSTRLNSSH